MAHYDFSSSSSNQVECPCSDYSEHYIWDYQYEALPFLPTNKTIGFAKQFSEIGKEFDDFWDFKPEAERLNLIADVATTEAVNVEEISTVVIGNGVVTMYCPLLIMRNESCSSPPLELNMKFARTATRSSVAAAVVANHHQR
nr:hypothetical protein Iba_chr02eCG2050 [Ipomoea batatas]GMC66102.1 hypothetical protein Iba_chr02eCG2490 [Ipomoea batatas]